MIKIEMRRPEFTAYRTAEGNTIIISDDFIVECKDVGKSWDCVVKLDAFEFTSRNFTCAQDHFVAYNEGLKAISDIHRCISNLIIAAFESGRDEWGFDVFEPFEL